MEKEKKSCGFFSLNKQQNIRWLYQFTFKIEFYSNILVDMNRDVHVWTSRSEIYFFIRIFLYRNISCKNQKEEEKGPKKN